MTVVRPVTRKRALWHLAALNSRRKCGVRFWQRRVYERRHEKNCQTSPTFRFNISMAPLVSLCMIVKNEEANLPQCLGTVADLVHEIVHVDTGSSDQTKAAGGPLRACVIDFTWIYDFAACNGMKACVMPPANGSFGWTRTTAAYGEPSPAFATCSLPCLRQSRLPDGISLA